MRIEHRLTALPNFHGSSLLIGVDQHIDTNLHLALIEAACGYNEEGGSEASSITLLNTLAEFMDRVGIFKPIIEVWESIRKYNDGMLKKGMFPRDCEKAARRGIHIPVNHVGRQSDEWEEVGTVVLFEDSTWGVVWLPSPSWFPFRLAAEEREKQKPDHYVYQPISTAELVALGFQVGGGYWSLTNSLLREVVISRERTEDRFKALSAMEQTLLMTEQITDLQDEK